MSLKDPLVVNFVMFLSLILEVTNPHTYISSLDFADFIEAIDFNILDSGLSEMIFLVC